MEHPTNPVLLDPVNDPGNAELTLEFMKTFLSEEFFPNARIARRVFAKCKEHNRAETYFSSLIRKTTVFISLDGKKVALAGILKPMDFESSVFGIKMATLGIYENMEKPLPVSSKQNLIDHVLEYAADKGIQHISCKEKPENCATMQALEKAGFLTVSNLITFLYIRNITKPPKWRSRYKVRKALPGDKDNVCSITKGAFSHTRFYNDPSLPDEKCDALYCEWARNCFDKGWASNIFIAEDSKANIVGYLTYLIDPSIKSIFGIVTGGSGISACLPGTRGAYPSLLIGSLKDVPKYDAAYCEYTTQSENSEVVRIWDKLGLDYGKTEIIFHKGLL